MITYPIAIFEFQHEHITITHDFSSLFYLVWSVSVGPLRTEHVAGMLHTRYDSYSELYESKTLQPTYVIDTL